MSYKDASFKNVNAVSLLQDEFETIVKAYEGKAKVTVKKDGDKLTFEIVSLDADVSVTTTAINKATTVAQVEAALESSTGFSPALSTMKTAKRKN